MSTLTIVLMALKYAASAIEIADGFITNPTVHTILDDVCKAIIAAVNALEPHVSAEQVAHKAALAGV